MHDAAEVCDLLFLIYRTPAVDEASKQRKMITEVTNTQNSAAWLSLELCTYRIG